MRSDDPGTVHFQTRDGGYGAMSIYTWNNKYTYQHPDQPDDVQRVRDNLGEISDNPNIMAVSNTVPPPMAVGGQSAASSHGGGVLTPFSKTPIILATVPGGNGGGPLLGNTATMSGAGPGALVVVGLAAGYAALSWVMGKIIMWANGTREGDLPARAEPNSTQVKDNGDGKGQIRDYGPDGRAVKDIDFGDPHGNVGDPHVHDWDWNKTPPRQPGRDLTPED